MAETHKKIDDEIVEITTTFDAPESTVIEWDRAELQTELDHIPDRLAEAQGSVDAVNERKAKLIEILKVFN